MAAVGGTPRERAHGPPARGPVPGRPRTASAAHFPLQPRQVVLHVMVPGLGLGRCRRDDDGALVTLAPHLTLPPPAPDLTAPPPAHEPVDHVAPARDDGHERYRGEQAEQQVTTESSTKKTTIPPTTTAPTFSQFIRRPLSDGLASMIIRFRTGRAAHRGGFAAPLAGRIQACTYSGSTSAAPASRQPLSTWPLGRCLPIGRRSPRRIRPPLAPSPTWCGNWRTRSAGPVPPAPPSPASSPGEPCARPRTSTGHGSGRTRRRCSGRPSAPRWPC